MRFTTLAVVVTGICFAAISPLTSRAQDALPALERFSPDQVDKSLDPCNDFFEYACNKWNKANPIPADQAGWGTFNSLAIWNVAAVHQTLETAAKPSPDRTAIEAQVGDYYASCMDTATIDKLGIKPLQPVLDRISAMKSKADLPEVVALAQRTVRAGDLLFTDAEYTGVLFGLYAQPDFDDASMTLAAFDQAGMGLPARDFYLKDDEKSKTIRDKYLAHIARQLELSGESKEQAARDATSVLALETGLANAAMDLIPRRDPKNQNNKMSLAQAQALMPSFDLARYLKAVHAPSSPQYLVLAPDFFRGIDKLIQSQPLDHWQAYLRWQVVSQMAGSLSDPFVQERFDFYGRTLGGAKEMQPRWRRCSFAADFDLGEAVGQAYVAKYFPPENKARMVQMVKAIEVALNQDIDAAQWMSPQTKQAAHVKLAAQVDKIGYPDQWRDYSSVEIKRNDFVGNVSRAAIYENDRRFAMFGQHTKRTDWNMTPPTVNAYEDPPTNTINFPAGILQPPFFDGSAQDAVNYGAIGMVIGHEIIHGFDDQGRKFDAQGNLRDWWTPEDAANYDQRDKCIQDEYTQDVPEAGVKQDGKLSAGEDTADNGGIHIALGALDRTLKAQGKTLDSPADGGLTQLQTFFLAGATVWCGDNRPEAARTAVMTQGHSLNRYRVNNVAGNMPEFEHAFGCHTGQPMVHPNQCRVW